MSDNGVDVNNQQPVTSLTENNFILDVRVSVAATNALRRLGLTHLADILLVCLYGSNYIRFGEDPVANVSDWKNAFESFRQLPSLVRDDLLYKIETDDKNRLDQTTLAWLWNKLKQSGFSFEDSKKKPVKSYNYSALLALRDVRRDITSASKILSTGKNERIFLDSVFKKIVFDFYRRITIYSHQYLEPDNNNIWVPAKIFHVRFKKCGSMFVTAGDDGLLKLWNTRNCRLIYTLKRHFSDICDIDLSHDGTTLVSCCSSSLVRTWSLYSNTWKPNGMSVLPACPTFIRFLPATDFTDRLFITTADDGILRIYDSTLVPEMPPLNSSSTVINYDSPFNDASLVDSPFFIKPIYQFSLFGYIPRSFDVYANPIFINSKDGNKGCYIYIGIGLDASETPDITTRNYVTRLVVCRIKVIELNDDKKIKIFHEVLKIPIDSNNVPDVSFATEFPNLLVGTDDNKILVFRAINPDKSDWKLSVGISLKPLVCEKMAQEEYRTYQRPILNIQDGKVITTERHKTEQQGQMFLTHLASIAWCDSDNLVIVGNSLSRKTGRNSDQEKSITKETEISVYDVQSVNKKSNDKNKNFQKKRKLLTLSCGSSCSASYLSIEELSYPPKLQESDSINLRLEDIVISYQSYSKACFLDGRWSPTGEFFIATQKDGCFTVFASCCNQYRSPIAVYNSQDSFSGTFIEQFFDNDFRVFHCDIYNRVLCPFTGIPSHELPNGPQVDGNRILLPVQLPSLTASDLPPGDFKNLQEPSQSCTNIDEKSVTLIKKFNISNLDEHGNVLAPVEYNSPTRRQLTITTPSTPINQPMASIHSSLPSRTYNGRYRTIMSSVFGNEDTDSSWTSSVQSCRGLPVTLGGLNTPNSLDSCDSSLESSSRLSDSPPVVNRRTVQHSRHRLRTRNAINRLGSADQNIIDPNCRTETNDFILRFWKLHEDPVNTFRHLISSEMLKSSTNENQQSSISEIPTNRLELLKLIHGILETPKQLLAFSYSEQMTLLDMLGSAARDFRHEQRSFRRVLNNNERTDRRTVNEESMKCSSSPDSSCDSSSSSRRQPSIKRRRLLPIQRPRRIKRLRCSFSRENINSEMDDKHSDEEKINNRSSSSFSSSSFISSENDKLKKKNSVEETERKNPISNLVPNQGASSSSSSENPDLKKHTICLFIEQELKNNLNSESRLMFKKLSCMPVGDEKFEKKFYSLYLLSIVASLFEYKNYNFDHNKRESSDYKNKKYEPYLNEIINKFPFSRLQELNRRTELRHKQQTTVFSCILCQRPGIPYQEINRVSPVFFSFFPIICPKKDTTSSMLETLVPDGPDITSTGYEKNLCVNSSIAHNLTAWLNDEHSPEKSNGMSTAFESSSLIGPFNLDVGLTTYTRRRTTSDDYKEIWCHASCFYASFCSIDPVTGLLTLYDSVTQKKMLTSAFNSTTSQCTVCEKPGGAYIMCSSCSLPYHFLCSQELWRQKNVIYREYPDKAVWNKYVCPKPQCIRSFRGIMTRMKRHYFVTSSGCATRDWLMSDVQTLGDYVPQAGDIIRVLPSILMSNPVVYPYIPLFFISPSLSFIPFDALVISLCYKYPLLPPHPAAGIVVEIPHSPTNRQPFVLLSEVKKGFERMKLLKKNEDAFLFIDNCFQRGSIAELQYLIPTSESIPNTKKESSSVLLENVEVVSQYSHTYNTWGRKENLENIWKEAVINNRLLEGVDNIKLSWEGELDYEDCSCWEVYLSESEGNETIKSLCGSKFAEHRRLRYIEVFNNILNKRTTKSKTGEKITETRNRNSTEKSSAPLIYEPFIKPIPRPNSNYESWVTDYWCEIELPITIDLIYRRLLTKFYRTELAVMFDVFHVYNNCIRFNGVNDHFSVLARKMVKEILDDIQANG